MKRYCFFATIVIMLAATHAGGLLGGLTDGVTGLAGSAVNTAVNTAKGVITLPTLVVQIAGFLAEIVANSDILGDAQTALQVRVIGHQLDKSEAERIAEIQKLVEPKLLEKVGGDKDKLLVEQDKVKERIHKLILIHDWIYDRITKPDVSVVTATAVRLMGDLVLPNKDGKMTVLPLNTQALDILGALKGLDINQLSTIADEYAVKNAAIKGTEL